MCNVIPERFEVPSYEKELEMRDLIDSCCTCEEERTFVAMREAGHTLAEIAVAIDKSPYVHSGWDSLMPVWDKLDETCRAVQTETQSRPRS